MLLAVRFLLPILSEFRYEEKGDKSEIPELLRIHILSCSARKQRAEECQILQPGSKCPCCALWGSGPCTHSLLDTLGPFGASLASRHTSCHRKPPGLPHSPVALQALAQGTFCEPGAAPHFTPALTLLLMDVLLPRTHRQSHRACLAFASPLKLHLPRGEHSPAGRFCSP